jgi:DNA-binding NtrC family response regulator
MAPGVVLTERVDGTFARKSGPVNQNSPGRPTVLIATIDPEIREGLAGLLEKAAVNAIWVSGVKDVKTLVAKKGIVACLCGFWLQDGTYREVVHYLRRERMDIPAIIVSAPACPQEFKDYLGALNLGALDFLPHPYQQSDFDRMLKSAIGARTRFTGTDSPEGHADLLHRGAA